MFRIPIKSSETAYNIRRNYRMAGATASRTSTILSDRISHGLNGLNGFNPFNPFNPWLTLTAKASSTVELNNA